MAEQRKTPMAVRTIPPPPVSRPAAAAELALTPKEVFAILRRHLWLVIIMTILGLLAGGTGWFLLRRYRPRYTAETHIKILPPAEKDPMVIGVAMGSRDILYGHRLSIANLITQQSTLMELIERDKVQKTEWFKRFGKIREKRILKAFKDLKKYFSVYAQRDAEFVTLTMTCGYKDESALIVNEMVDLFLASYGSTKKKEISGKLTALEEQRSRVQMELDSVNRAMDDIRQAFGFTDLEEQYFEDTITLTLNDLELQENSLALAIIQVKADMGNLEELTIGLVNEQVEDLIENDPTVIVLTQQLVLQESRLAGALTRLGENHRDVRRLRESINDTRLRRDNRRAEIAEQTRQANFKNAQDQLIVLQSRFEELVRLREEAEAGKKEYDLARVQYERRLAIRDEREKMLGSVKTQIEKMKLLYEDPETSKVLAVSRAVPPLRMSSPKWQVYFPGGTMLGIMFGVGLAFLIEILNDLVRTPRDVVRFLRIPLLGVIPDADQDDQVDGVDLCHVIRQAPYSIISESYRRFRTNLKLSDSGANARTLLVSGAMPADGATSVAVNLATSFVAENKTVLLIDANFWQPILHTVFPRPASQDRPDEQADLGLSNLLTGQCGPAEAVRASGIENLDLIDAGPLASNPTELLGSTQMQQLIKQQRDNYDYVIVDGPPALLVSDAKLLAGFVDGTVLVFNAAATRRGAALRTIRELRGGDASIVGCVLFAVKAMKGGYFHEQFKSYRKYQKLQLARAIS